MLAGVLWRAWRCKSVPRRAVGGEFAIGRSLPPCGKSHRWRGPVGRRSNRRPHGHSNCQRCQNSCAYRLVSFHCETQRLSSRRRISVKRARQYSRYSTLIKSHMIEPRCLIPQWRSEHRFVSSCLRRSGKMASLVCSSVSSSDPARSSFTGLRAAVRGLALRNNGGIRREIRPPTGNENGNVRVPLTKPD